MTMDPIRKMILNEIFDATLEDEIPGTLGQILIFRLPPNTDPKRLAVKTVMPDHINNRTPYKALQRFEHEIKQWIRYRHHPFVIAPFFTRVVENWPYVAMPYCEATLRHYIDGAIPKGKQHESIALLIESLTALEYAHSRGLIAHQDLKPENILLRNLHNIFRMPEEYPFRWVSRLADFGLANAYTELGIPWGSRPYLAPEQYTSTGNFAAVDTFACGVMLCELVTGRHPLGVVISQVWPLPAPGQSGKWTRPDVWKKWAHSEKKLSAEIESAAGPYADVIESALAVNPDRRIALSELRKVLMSRLERDDSLAFENLVLLLNQYDGICRESESYEETVERYEQARIAEILKLHLR